ncbi:MAG: hypothetical protein M1822_006273 [Bathelium mastoideum]|nr:MAG: hypothetical protein M1822_006273 [Bathelium mastoideum]
MKNFIQKCTAFIIAIPFLLRACNGAAVLEKRVTPEGMSRIASSGATEDKWTWVAVVKDTSNAPGPMDQFASSSGVNYLQKALNKAEQYYRSLAAAYPDPGYYERNGKKWIRSQMVACVYWRGRGYYCSQGPVGLQWSNLVNGRSGANRGERLLKAAMGSTETPHAEESALEIALQYNPLSNTATRLPANLVFVAVWGRWGGPDGENGEPPQGDYEWANEEKTEARAKVPVPVGHQIRPCSDPTASKDPACETVLRTMGAVF